MMLCVGVEKPSDHSLILSVVFQRLALEEVDAPLAHCKRYLDTLFLKDQVFRRRKKI